ncbi:HTTM domain-containing protein [Agromyces mangrovi Wang et al. 2018]|uniref:HTTM domain-containing protein n=1 Tax=Agromyces mangrovi TaxID=1858653 RepID=UPI002573BC3F|nr:HTTM domain-containing protein [Agromyces mangrovi]BDZ65049.1 hypothetical protein GCM10025877_19870 [Agromyces mangrovi]
MQRLLTKEVDARPLAVSRIVVGLAAMGVSLEWAIPLLRLTTGEYLRTPVLWGAPSPSVAFVLFIYIMTLVGAMGMALGALGRAAPSMVGLACLLALLADQQVYSNHALLLLLLSILLALSDAHRTLSILRRNRGPVQVAYWPAFLIRALLSSVYLWTAIAKVNGDYLAGDVFAHFGNDLMGLLAPVLPALAVTSIVTELFVGIALWVRPLFPLALLAGIGLHTGIIVTLHDPYPLVLFAMLMAPAYLLAGAEWVRGGGALVERAQLAWSAVKRRMPRRRGVASSAPPA